jgi:predicted N-acetyltransferase YhbS
VIALPTTLTDAAARSRATVAIAAVVTAHDHAALGALHDQVFGPGALTRTAYRVREGAATKHTPYCRLLRDGQGHVIAFIRFAPVLIGGATGALMLGPLAVAPAHAGQGHARRLIADGLHAASSGGIHLAVLVGDLSYYGRLGFAQIPLGRMTMPGPVDPARLLAFELTPGAMARFSGMISAAHG